MRKRRFALFLLSCSCLASSLPAQSRSASRPNIIFIMSDDHAAHAISAYGSRVNRTPNIDRLAREGALLTIVVHAGQPARFRLMNLTAVHPNAVVVLTARPDSAFANVRDTAIVRWMPVAKDGADLPSAARTSRPALQTVSMGETHDFEFVPERRGQVLRLEVRTAGGRPGGILVARVPVRVE